MSEKIKTARLSVISNTSLIIMKLTVGFLTGSVSIISEAIHSFIDLLAAVIAYFCVKISDTPPDQKHPFGHGKFENVSGVVEAVLIFIAAGWIIFEAIKKILHPTEIVDLHLGIAVMAISGIVNFFVSSALYKVAKKTDSIALEADALHLKVDVITSLGVAVGLLLILITKLTYLDPIVAIIVALFILKESFDLLQNAYSPLLDTSLSEDELAKICEIIKKYNFTYHDLKTRKAGNYRFANLHLEMPEDMTLKNAHEICDKIEEEIKEKLKNIDINIHVEPANAG